MKTQTKILLFVAKCTKQLPKRERRRFAKTLRKQRTQIGRRVAKIIVRKIGDDFVNGGPASDLANWLGALQTSMVR